jgi:hypothetical protein
MYPPALMLPHVSGVHVRSFSATALGKTLTSFRDQMYLTPEFVLACCHPEFVFYTFWIFQLPFNPIHGRYRIYVGITGFTTDQWTESVIPTIIHVGLPSIRLDVLELPEGKEKPQSG